jgi:hypothetical protein
MVNMPVRAVRNINNNGKNMPVRAVRNINNNGKHAS